MKSILSILMVLLLLFSIQHVSSTKSSVCDELKCGKDQVCDREAAECVNKDEMTEGRPCQIHEDCRDDHICYVGRCIFFHGRRLV